MMDVYKKYVIMKLPIKSVRGTAPLTTQQPALKGSQRILAKQEFLGKGITNQKLKF